MTEPEVTLNDQKLAHTVFDHLVFEVYNGLLTALDESIIMKAEDARFNMLHEELQPIMDKLEEIIHTVLDTIPGLPSREESENIVRKTMDRSALLEGLPLGSFTPEKEIKH